jgi:hypothetical protein
MGGNLVNYPNDCSTPTADIITVKILLNSIVSTLNAKFMTIDLKDFYLMTPMSRYEYFRMKLDLFPEDIIEEYNLKDITDSDGNIFAKSNAACTAFPRPAFSHKNSSRNASSSPGTVRARSPRDIGHTHGAPSALPSLSMTLVSNASTRTTSTISSKS